MTKTDSTATGTSVSTIFVGSSVGLDGLAAQAIASPLIADGDVSFYGHMMGIVSAYDAGTEQSLLSTWAGTGSGLIETTQNEPMAMMWVTIENTSGTAITVPMGQLVSSASGVQFQLVQTPRAADGWSSGGSGDGSRGFYTIQPGQSLTVLTQALKDGPQGNLLANQVTQIGVAGAAITGSSLQTAAPQWGAGTITLVNKSGSTQTISERTAVTGSGGTYQIGVDPTNPSFIATDADGSSGYYVLKAGTTLTVPIYSTESYAASDQNLQVQQEDSEDAAANSITGGSLPASVAIASSSAITTQGITDPTAQDHASTLGSNSGFYTDSSAQLFLADQGYVPAEADVNTFNANIWTALDLQNWEAYVDNARAFGLLNLAPMMSEFETVDFATSTATQYARAGALYSGGIAFDMPSWFFLAREPAYQQSVEAEIKWATQNGLRSSITISPIGPNDTTFLWDTQQMVSMLKAAGALPTQFVVKDEAVTGTSTIFSTTDPNAFNNIAQYLSGLTLTPSNSEAGLEQHGTTTRPDDLMTGVQQSEVIVGGGSVLPFQIAQLFADTKSTQATVTVMLGNASLGRLAAGIGGGSVSAGGAVFTMTGTMAQLTLGLQSLSFAAAASALGSTTLTITVADAVGAITGSTALTIDNAISLSGVAATLSCGAPLTTDPSLSLTTGAQTATLTATVTLSNASLGSFWNMTGATVSADGTTLTIGGSAAILQTFLRQLVFVSAPGVSGQEIESVAVSDGTQTASATTLITVLPPSGLAVGNVPATAVAAPFALDAPYQDILITNAGSPSQVMTATVSLPSGVATLAASGAGTRSADGLSYTLSGTAAQLQAALRSLQLSIPARAATSVETMTLSIGGQTTTTTVRVVSSDTVYVGALDSNQDTYANATIATPLLATGKIGLFEDYNGMTAATTSGSAPSLAATWSGASAGDYGYSYGLDVATQTITIRNGSTVSIKVPVGSLATTAGGTQFQVVQYNGYNAGWSAGSSGDGTLGTYTIAAGASLTVPVEALAQGFAGNAVDNAITGLRGIAGATITGSTTIGLATEYAGGTVTLTNTTSGWITVWDGTTVSGTTGAFAIGNSPGAAYYVTGASDSSYGSYSIAPGGSTTVSIYGINAQNAATLGGVLNQILAQTTSATNSVTGGALPTGISITGSSAIVATGPATAAQGATWGGWGAGSGVLTQRGYGYFVQQQGFTPSESNTNVYLGTNFTSADLASWKAYVDTMRGLGVMNVAPTVSTYTTLLDISSSDVTANLRQAALYGGGIDIDLSPSTLLSAGASGMTALVDDLRWGAANGLRTTMTLRAGTDPSFYENTKAMVAQLQAAGTAPSQMVVIGDASASAPTNPELANMVAQYLAGLPLTSSTSESGLSTTGGTTVRSIMTGVQRSEVATGTVAITPLAGVQVFAESAADLMTARVALNSVTLGVLSTTGAGTVSADGSTITIAGTPASIAMALRSINYTPAAGAVGSTAIDVSITDVNGTITGQTRLSVSNPSLPASLSVAALGTATGPATVTVSTLASEHDVLSATAGGTVSNGTFQIVGTAVADAVALAGLRVTPGSGITSPSLQVAISGSAISLIDSGSGADTLTSAGGNSIRTGIGMTTVAAGSGDTILAGSGTVSASSKSNFTFLGGSGGHDTVTGGAGGGSFTAGTGGHSKLAAGTGTTILHAAGSNDTLLGGGSSTLYGASGDATIMRTVNGDAAIGADGSTIFGPATGDGNVQAGVGSETVYGGAGSMTVTGGTGFLHAVMGSGGGVVDGGSGNTQVTLGAGSVSVVGGSGSGTVYGGTGHASVTEGSGKQIYNFTRGVSTGEQLIAFGFVPAKDQIVLSGYGSGAAAQLVQSQVQSSGSTGTILTLSDGASITVSGISHISASNITTL